MTPSVNTAGNNALKLFQFPISRLLPVKVQKLNLKNHLQLDFEFTHNPT